MKSRWEQRSHWIEIAHHIQFVFKYFTDWQVGFIRQCVLKLYFRTSITFPVSLYMVMGKLSLWPLIFITDLVAASLRKTNLLLWIFHHVFVLLACHDYVSIKSVTLSVGRLADISSFGRIWFSKLFLLH